AYYERLDEYGAGELPPGRAENAKQGQLVSPLGDHYPEGVVDDERADDEGDGPEHEEERVEERDALLQLGGLLFGRFPGVDRPHSVGEPRTERAEDRLEVGVVGQGHVHGGDLVSDVEQPGRLLESEGDEGGAAEAGATLEAQDADDRELLGPAGPCHLDGVAHSEPVAFGGGGIEGGLAG